MTPGRGSSCLDLLKSLKEHAQVKGVNAPWRNGRLITETRSIRNEPEYLREPENQQGFKKQLKFAKRHQSQMRRGPPTHQIQANLGIKINSD